MQNDDANFSNTHSHTFTLDCSLTRMGIKQIQRPNPAKSVIRKALPSARQARRSSAYFSAVRVVACSSPSTHDFSCGSLLVFWPRVPREPQLPQRQVSLTRSYGEDLFPVYITVRLTYTDMSLIWLLTCRDFGSTRLRVGL